MKSKKQHEQQDILSFPWRQAAKINRILTGLNFMQAVVIIGLTVLIIFLFPLKEKIPVFIALKDGSNNFVRVLAAGRNIPNQKQLIRYFIRDYVWARETVDKITERDAAGRTGRYSKVWSMSGSNVKEVLKNLYLNTDTGLYFKAGFNRHVEIINDNELGLGVHLVELATTDTTYGKNKRRGKWTVTLSYQLLDQQVSYADGLLNPLGIFITEYSIQRKNGGKE